MTDSNFASVRGLVDSDIGPLRRFIGKLDSAPEESKKYNEGTKDERTSYLISLNFKDLDIKEEIEPYNLPIFTIQLTKSNRKKSKYGVFGMSLVEILDSKLTTAQKDPNSPEYIPPQKRPDLKDMLGKRIGMVVADSTKEDPTGRPMMHELFDGRAVDEKHPRGQDMPVPTWEVYFVEGYGMKGVENVSPLEQAIKLLDGKTINDFNTAAFQNEAIRGDVQLLQEIGLPVSAPNSFTNKMVAEGKFTKDANGVFHKVGVAATPAK